MTVKKYAGDRYVGLSTDTKPTNVIDGAIFTETDTRKIYLKVSGTWSEVDYDNYTDAEAVSAIKADADWNATEWDTAYGWGDHSTEGYITDANSDGKTYGRKDGGWTEVTGGGATDLVDLGDVVITNKATGKILQVNADGDHEYVDLPDPDVSGLVPYTGATGAVNLGENNLTVDTNTLFVDSVNHRMGVGTTTPSQKLEVAGNINIDGTSAYLYDGYNAIKLSTKGDSDAYSSTIIGREAGDTKTDGTTTRQTAVGKGAGQSNTGSHQTALGYHAGRSNKGSRQTAVGTYAGNPNTGADQTAVGMYAGSLNTGNYQTAIGYYAGYQNSGINQTSLGYYAGYKNTGDGVTGIGYEATRQNTADNVVSIGYQAGKGNAVANQFIVKQANINAVPLIQGDFATGNVGINDTAPAEKLDVDGNINLTGVLKIDDVQVLKEQQAHIEDLKTDYTTGDLDTEAEIITAINTTNAKINAILAMLETHGLVASS